MSTPPPVPTPFSLEGRTVVVTGASSGLGRHFARVAASHGAKAVALLARREQQLEKVASELRDTGATVVTAVADVSDPDSVDAAVASITDRLGPIDVLVNNAGGATVSRAVDVPYEEWQSVQASNLGGTFLMSRAVARHSIAVGEPLSIINIASVLGLRVMPGTAAYASSKAGVVQLTKQLAIEWARHGIRVNALCPGYFPTEAAEFQRDGAQEQMASRVPMRRLGQLAELDGPLLLLASEAGSYLTGATISVDGGLASNSV